jgi:hypothetical protein
MKKTRSKKSRDTVPLRSQKGIPALHQEASPGSGDVFKFFARVLSNEPKGDSCTLLEGFRIKRRFIQGLCHEYSAVRTFVSCGKTVLSALDMAPPFVHFPTAKGGKKTIAHLRL